MGSSRFHADESMHNPLNAVHPSLPLHHPNSPQTNLLYSPLNPSPHFSPNLTSDHAFTSSLIVGFAKRDWLSSLSQLSSAPTVHIPSSVSSLANSQPKAQRSMLALRLSDVKAALQAKPFESHLSNSANASANASLSSPTSAESGVPSKVINPATMLNEVMQNTRKAHEFEDLARRKCDGARRKCNGRQERERRQGMKDLYGTLGSLLPDEKIKANMGSVLTGTMDYIQSLLKQKDELDKQKVEVIRSMKTKNEINNTKPNAEINATKTSHIVTNCNFVKASLSKHAKTREIEQTHALAKSRTSEDFKRQAKEKFSAKKDVRKNRVDVRVRKENAKSQNSIDENHKVKDGANSNKLDNPNNNGTMNGDESAMESHGTREEVCVKFFGEDAIINVCTSKRRGAWSSLLEFLEQLDIYILDATLSNSLDCNHHHIRAKVSSNCKLSSSDLQERLIAFVR